MDTVHDMTANQSGQRHYYEEECDPEFEIIRPRQCGRLYEFLINCKFQTGYEVLGFDLRGKSVLEVCCGSGLMSEDLARHGALVTGIDFSEAAIERARERARRYGFAATFLTGDAEHLSFPDHSFDVVAVHDGLHHLDDPLRAIQEMTRIASKGVLILEPAQAVLTQFAVKIGLAEEIEEAGNYVRRLVPHEVERCLQQAGFTRVRWRRTLMYYPHQPFAWFHWFDSPLLFSLFRTSFVLVNTLGGRWGNKLAIAGVKTEA